MGHQATLLSWPGNFPATIAGIVKAAKQVSDVHIFHEGNLSKAHQFSRPLLNLIDKGSLQMHRMVDGAGPTQVARTKASDLGTILAER